MNGEMEASLWGAVLGALLGAFAGGLVSHFSEGIHEARRRRETLLDQIADLTIEFGVDVNSYWSSSGQDATMQSKIISGISKIRKKLMQIDPSLANGADARLLIKEIYQFATGGTFATKHHVPDSKRPQDVDRRLEQLLHLLSQQRSRKT